MKFTTMLAEFGTFLFLVSVFLLLLIVGNV